MFVEERIASASADRSPSGGGGGAALEGLATERLEQEIAELASHLWAGTARFLELVGELDRRGAALTWGCRSTAEWISWQCGIALRAAREQVRVARALRELTAIRAAFARGELSYSKARALTRVADPASEQELLELARHATASQLERIVRAYRRCSNEEGELAWERRHLSLFWEEDGSLTLHGRLPAEEGALFRRALDAACDALREAERNEGGEDPGEGEGCSAEPALQREAHAGSRITHADALCLMAETMISVGASELMGAERYQVVLHLDGDRPHLDDGPAISPEAAARLACDASLVPIVESNARASPLSVGRRRRTVPPVLRRALEARDAGCRFPGCERRRFTDAHHVRHWAEGGETSLENLVLLCRHHHRLVHEGRFSVRRRRRGPGAGELRFLWRDGSPLEASPAPPPGDPAALRRANRERGLPLGPDTVLSGSGERMDLAMCVDAVFAAKGSWP